MKKDWFHHLLSASGLGAGEKQAKRLPLEGGERILVAYFSYSGETRKAAWQIAERIHADLFEIVPVRAYPPRYEACTQIARKEAEEDRRPPIKETVNGMDDYDIVFLGYLVWWYKAPMPVYTFLEEHNVTGKIVVPFCTSGGSRLEDTLPDLKRMLPASFMAQGRRVYSSRPERTEAWLSELGF